MKVLAELTCWQLWRITFDNFLHLKKHCFKLGIWMFSSCKFYLLTFERHKIHMINADTNSNT